MTGQAREVVALRDAEMLDWLVPTTEWQRFREHVQDEHGSLDGYLGRAAERAMREYADTDGYNEVEDRVDRLVQAAGRHPETVFEEKTSLSEQATTRVTVRVDQAVKDDFRRVADASDDPYGVEFARAIRAYRDGGRAARLERKLDRILDDAEALLGELEDADGDGGLSVREQRVIRICNRLPDGGFSDEELVAEIQDVAGSSKPTIQDYREAVIERLEFEPHPNTKTLVWISPGEAAEIVPEGAPEVCRRPLFTLDRDARVERLQYAVGRRAFGNSQGRAIVDTANIEKGVFGGDVSRSTVLEYMEEAALDDGYAINRSGDTASLLCRLEDVADSDPEFFRALREYHESDADDLLSPVTTTTVDDWTGDQPVGPQGPSFGREISDTLFANPDADSGTAAPDGGSDGPGGDGDGR